MPKKIHLSDIMETSCPHCRSHYRITDEQLQTALGRAKCSQCGMIFNALQSLKSFDGVVTLDHQQAPVQSNEITEQAEN